MARRPALAPWALPALAALGCLLPAVAWAQAAPAPPGIDPPLVTATVAQDAQRALVWLLVGSLAPLLAVAATAFAKASILLGLLRSGLGAQGALPVAVTTALAALLTVLVMTPVAQQASAAAGPLPPADGDWAAALDRGWPAVEAFLIRHTDADDAAAIRGATAGLSAPAPGPAAPPADPAPEGAAPGAPAPGVGSPSPAAPSPVPPAAATPSRAEQVMAFLISELGAAFELGVLLLLPFLIVDLLTANTLTTVGFTGLPAPVVALPFKLLLFVAADGWVLFARGFLQSYGP